MRESARIAILTYHSLDETGSVLSISPQVFAEQMSILKGLRARVIPLAEARRVPHGSATHEPVVAITFDDGFRNVYDYGLPILERYGFQATVFLVTDYCGKTNSWPGQPSWVTPQPLLRWAEVIEMSKAGVTLGSHSRTHPDLRTVSAARLREEMIFSKKAIEDATGRPVETLAYPYGACDGRVKEMARSYFSLACGVTLGFAAPESDAYDLERLDMYYLRSPILFRRLFSQGIGAYIGVRGALRNVRNLGRGVFGRR